MEKANRYVALSRKDVSQGVERKGNLDYLSWAYAWNALVEEYPDSTYYFGEPTTFPDGSVMVRATSHNRALSRCSKVAIACCQSCPRVWLLTPESLVGGVSATCDRASACDRVFACCAAEWDGGSAGCAGNLYARHMTKKNAMVACIPYNLCNRSSLFALSSRT